MSTSRPRVGAPRLEPKQPAHGSAVVSSLRMPLSVVTNGGLRGDVQHRREPLAQEELPEAGAHRGLAVALHVPGEAEARSEVVVVLVHQRAVRAVGAAESAGVLAPCSLPGGCSRPLHGSAPSAGLKSAGTKLVI